MRIRTYGVVRGVMLKHPPTRLFREKRNWRDRAVQDVCGAARNDGGMLWEIGQV